MKTVPIILYSLSILWLLSPCTAQSGDYAKELALARKVGMPTTLGELKHRSIPESQNAAPIYRRLSSLLNEKGKSGSDVDAMVLMGRKAPTAGQTARARRILAAHAALLRGIHDAASRPDCEFNRNWSLGPAVMFPEYSRMRSAARWLAAESGALLAQGKPVEAVHNMALGFRIARHAEADPVLIAHLVAVALDAITFRGMQTILYRAAGDPNVATAIDSEIQSRWRPLSLAHAISGELVISEVSLDLVRTGGLPALRQLTDGTEPSAFETGHVPTAAERQLISTILDANGAYIVHWLRLLYEKADGPYVEAQGLANALAKDMDSSKDPKRILAMVMLPVYDEVPSRRAYDESHAAVLRTVAAILRFRAEHRTLPDRLDQAISPVPSDPFDLKPLRYRREGNGFVVYSVGQTGKFDGRARDAKQYNREAVFAWPGPKFFGMPRRSPNS